MSNFLEILNPVAKWLHIIAGVMWIGLLYFFNFINGHVAATLDADTKKKVVPELMPRTLYWFRWGAAWTWFTGVVLMVLIFWVGMGDSMFATDPNHEVSTWIGNENSKLRHLSYIIPFLMVFIYDFLYLSPIGKNTRVATIISFLGTAGILCLLTCVFGMIEYRAYNIHIGAMFGSMMAFNVWFRIWPAQQRIISAIRDGETPDGADVALAGLRSKHNTYMSVPLIWTMINEHTAVVNKGFLLNCDGLLLLIFIAIGWHLVFQLYKKSGKIKGF